MAKAIFGVGINDADYQVRDSKAGTLCPFYKVWHSMLRRCYSTYTHDIQGAYIECEVCEEWKRFSNFRAWMLEQQWNNKQLDKDFLGESKVYSPETCVFLPQKLNNLIIRRGKGRQEHLRGVVLIPETGKYRARVNLGKLRKHLGMFDDEREAHKAYLEAKLEIVKNYLQEFSEDAKIVSGLKRIADKIGTAIETNTIVEDI